MTQKEKLIQSLLEERAGLALSNPDSKLVIEKNVPSLPDDDDMIDEQDFEDDDISSVDQDQKPAESILSRAFGNKESGQVVVANSFGNTQIIKETKSDKGDLGSALKSSSTLGSALKSSSTLGSALKSSSTLGSALKSSSTLGSALKSTLGSALKSLKPAKKKRRQTKVESSESDDSSNSEKEKESRPEEKGSLGLWATDIMGDKKPQEKVSSPTAAIETKEIDNKKIESAVQQAEKEPAKPAFFVPVNRSEDVQVARMSLPVVGEEQPIMETILANSVTILCGETGSGKTTQVPQFLYEAGFGDPNHPLYPGMIGVTQPRRVAAVSMAKRVAYEMNLDDGQVTYQIRYDKAQLGKNTRIKFMTDGILLRELSSLVDNSSKKGDLLLTSYSCIIIDEAHERTVGTDILIGWLTRIVKLRNSGKIQGVKPLKLIIMSATLRVEDFTLNKSLFPCDSVFEKPPPVLKVDGRQHKVVIHYNKRTPEMDYVSEAFKKVVKIHNKLPRGAVLVFLTGQQEVEVLVRKLRKRFPPPSDSKSETLHSKEEEKISTGFFEEIDNEPVQEDGVDDFDDVEQSSEVSDDEEEKVQILNGTIEEEKEEETDLLVDEESKMDGPLHVLPLYSMLSSADQMRVFDEPPEGSRLVVVATNVAETSLTIPGIRYVVDCGKAKERCYDTQTGIQNFKVSWTSKASADQRAGRAGRVGPGHCYRLFSSAVFENYFEKFSKPEILRIPIPGVVLSMKSMGINQVIGFPFPTPPDRNQLKDAESLLKHLEAVKSVNNHMKITPVGKMMAQFPVSPRHGKMIVVAAKQAPAILPYTIAIVAGLSVGEVFFRDMELINDQKRKEESDDDCESMDDEEKEQRRRKRGKFFKSMQDFAGKDPTSDFIMLLNAIGAYVSQMRFSTPSQLETFCRDHFLRPKALDEVVKLMKQITNISNTVFGTNLVVDCALDPPTSRQETLLKQVILSGYVDCVARLDETARAGKGAHSLPCYQTMWSNETEQLVLHSSSCLFRERPAPKWVVFDQVQAHQQVFGAEGNLIELRASSDGIERKFLKGITVIQEGWLVKQVPTLCNMGKVLEQPEPRYHRDLDLVKGFVSPTFGMKFWPLGLTETTLEGGKEAASWFAKALLEGNVKIGQGKNSNVFTLLMVICCLFFIYS